MMAACQPFVSGAISKTVNMPEDVTSKEIRNAYMEGWRLGLKALAIYRENSKRSQPLSTSQGGNTKGSSISGDALPTNGINHQPSRKRLPDNRMALTHKFSVAGHKGEPLAKPLNWRSIRRFLRRFILFRVGFARGSGYLHVGL